MSLVIDGRRSLKYRRTGERLVAQAKEIGVPSLTTMRNGFRVKGWQQDSLSKVSIKAPMGAVVLCSTASGVIIASADYWQGGFTGPQDYFTGTAAIPDNTGWLFWGQEVPKTTKFVPDMTDVSVYDYSTDLYVTGKPLPPEPSLSPLGIEAYWVGLNGTSVIDGVKKNMYENSLTPYESNGEPLKRFGEHWNFGYLSGVVQILPAEGSLRTVRHSQTAYWWLDNYLCCADVARWNVGWYPLESIRNVDAFSGMPSEVLAAAMPPNTQATSILPCGSYAYAKSGEAPVVFLHAANMFASTAMNAYFSTHPEDKKWQLTLSFRDSALAWTTISSAQFIGLMNTLSGGVIIVDGVVDYGRAREMWRTFFPRPNRNARAPYDSVMFHNPVTEKIYTWTRAYGGIEFSKEGMKAATFSVPPAASSTAGVRPDISYAGDGIYFCACTKETVDSISVIGTYTGSPFSGWTELQKPVEGELLHVRPVQVTADSINLLGVIKKLNPETGLFEYYFSFYTKEDGWRTMGKIPVDPVGRTNWSACLFGDGPGVALLKKYPTQPPVLMQMPHFTYSSYVGLNTLT